MMSPLLVALSALLYVSLSHKYATKWKSYYQPKARKSRWTHTYDLLTHPDVTYILRSTLDDWPDNDNPDKFFQGEPNVDYGITLAKLYVNANDDTARLVFKGFGFPTAWVVTGWFFFPPSLGGTHPIWTEGIAGPQTPIAPTTASFNSGRDSFREPNTFKVDNKGNMQFRMDLDYNPLKKLQVPLLNELNKVQQINFPNTISDGDVTYNNLQQPMFFNSGTYTTVGREYIREYDQSNGFQVLEDNGKAKVIRAPTAALRLPIVAHLDYISHGTHSSIFCPSIFEPGNWGCGDHFQLALFDIDKISMD